MNSRMATPSSREVSNASSPKRGLGRRFKRALVAGGVLCSLMLPLGGYLAPRYYAPRIPVEWREQVHTQAKWVHDLWLQSRFPKTVLDRKVEQAVHRVRLFPPAYLTQRQREVHLLLDKPGAPEGTLEGENLPFEDSYWPPALRQGAIMIQGLKPVAHEFVNYLGESHLGLMASHYQAAAAVGRYLDPRSLVSGQKDIPVRLELSGSRATMYFLGTKANGSYEFDLDKIEKGFHHPTTELDNHHNDWSSPGNELGHLVRLEETRLKKPGYGLFVIRLVAQGTKVSAALKQVLAPALEMERRELVRNNPTLDWLNSPRP